MIELPETKIYKMGNTALLGAKYFYLWTKWK